MFIMCPYLISCTAISIVAKCDLRIVNEITVLIQFLIPLSLLIPNIRPPIAVGFPALYVESVGPTLSGRCGLCCVLDVCGAGFHAIHIRQHYDFKDRALSARNAFDYFA